MSTTDYKILLVEDDAPLAELIKEYLEDNKFVVDWADCGDDAKTALTKSQYDIIICDVNLPDIQGFDLIKELKLPVKLPVLFLTALSDADSQITGLNAGACDYIVKPIEPEVLLARINAHLRHSNPTASGDILTIASMKLDNIHKSFEYCGNEVKLTNQEFELLWFFANKGDDIITREVIFAELIGRNYDGADRAADLRVSRFRKKMESLGFPELTVDSIRNQGYVFNYWAAIR